MVIQTPITIEAFEAFIKKPEHQGSLFELINGEIVEKMPTEEHGIIAGNIITEINLYLRQHKIGRAGVEIRHRMPGDDRNSFLPDVAFIADLNRAVVDKGAVPRMPDLAVEIQSPDDSLKLLREKVRYYLANGAKLVWLVLIAQRMIEGYTLDKEYILTENDLLTGEDILPGFEVPVRQIFEW